MFVKVCKVTFFAVMAAGLLAGCTGGRAPGVFAGFNGDPHCAPGPKPCPRDMYPEFPLPPGGPYLETPANVNTGAPARLNLNAEEQQKLTIAK